MLSRLLTRREQAILGGLALALFTGSLSLIFVRHNDGAVALIPPNADTPLQMVSALPQTAAGSTADRPEAPAPEPELIGVAITGAVKLPGLYYLERGARVRDLIHRAGGTTPSAHLDNIEAGAVLLDATTLEIPADAAPDDVINPAPYLRVAPAPPRLETGALTPPRAVKPGAGLININIATQSELESLHGIGPALALRIINFRSTHHFTSPEELIAVPGIGEKKLAAIRGQITAE